MFQIHLMATTNRIGNKLLYLNTMKKSTGNFILEAAVETQTFRRLEKLVKRRRRRQRGQRGQRKTDRYYSSSTYNYPMFSNLISLSLQPTVIHMHLFPRWTVAWGREDGITSQVECNVRQDLYHRSRPLGIRFSKKHNAWKIKSSCSRYRLSYFFVSQFFKSHFSGSPNIHIHL